MLLALVDDCNLLYRDISHTIVFITKIKHTILNIDHIAAKGSISAARHVYLFAS